MDSYFTPKVEPDVRPDNANVTNRTKPKEYDAVSKGISWLKKLVS